MTAQLDRLLDRSDLLDEAIAHATAFDGHVVGSQPMLAAGQASLSIQLGRAQRHLLRCAMDAPAMALVRVQFESTTRAVWLASAANEAQVSRYAVPDHDGELKGTNQGPSVDDMLNGIGASPATHLSEALRALKAATWRAMNHYSHGSMIAVVQANAQRQPDKLINAVLNSNGMLLIAANVALVATRHRPTAVLKALAAEYSDCLPPAV